MSSIEFLPYVIALSIAAAIPGPGITAMVGRALGAGFRPTLPFAFGLMTGDIVYLTLAVLGLAALVKLFAGLFLVIKLMGAAYLIFLAWQFWHAGFDAQKLSGRPSRGFWSSFAGGLALTLGNPKVIIFYMALLPTVVDLPAITADRYLVLVALTYLVLIAVVLPYMGLAARARRFLTEPKGIRLLNRSAAAAIAGAAAFIVVRH